MNKTILKEFGNSSPRVIVLDDSDRPRAALRRELESEGLEVSEFSDVKSFEKSWAPGMFDLIVADWDLSEREKGDEVLASIRESDWDVPFILISGRLNEDGPSRSQVFESMLSEGNCDFVERGDDASAQVIKKAFKLIEQRDFALLRVVLRFRQAALEEKQVKTTSGSVSALDILAELVRSPSNSHDVEGPLADRITRRLMSGIE